ncbi:uridine kinase family protein [Halobacillus amylolyticus]|uniref:Uridine kinase n=1 Tax=Halobacillus amylolyticus TaxID=2932259 RepID=A0ABY4HGG2_9BACI|nr:uridine kinase [Halobacillus amylolyticus]UOR13468.1 uridine kinase [Halobacillus amylolyticus]
MEWLKNNKKNLLLVGIDGCGGAGKSTLADHILSIATEGIVIHMDDFYLPSHERKEMPDIGGHFDWKRVLHQVIKPLSERSPAEYQRYDWDHDELAEWHHVSASGVVVVEGCYATRDDLRPYYDYTIWVDCPREVRLKRGLERDGQEALPFWLDWMEQEDRYIEIQHPRDQVDFIIKGTRNN